jgi:hypothetical protein
VALSLLVRPGERDDHAVAPRLDGIEVGVPITGLPSRDEPFPENRTGLVGAVSGRRRPEPRQPAPSAPLHVGVDQRDERLRVAFAKRLIRGANHVNGHAERVLRGRRPRTVPEKLSGPNAAARAVPQDEDAALFPEIQPPYARPRAAGRERARSPALIARRSRRRSSRNVTPPARTAPITTPISGRTASICRFLSSSASKQLARTADRRPHHAEASPSCHPRHQRPEQPLASPKPWGEKCVIRRRATTRSRGRATSEVL